MISSSGKSGNQNEGLTEFQIEVIQAFFSIPESSGFLLAGGSGLIAQNLSSRPTKDIDFFTGPSAGVLAAARDGLIREATFRGMEVVLLRDTETFCRLVLRRAGTELPIDLAVDSRPEHPPISTTLGPSYAPPEIAGRKTVALFDRAEARDFVDVYNLSARFGADNLLAWAAEIDAGFDLAVFREMLARLDRFADHEIPIDRSQVTELRAFFKDWTRTLPPGTRWD